MAQWA